MRELTKTFFATAFMVCTFSVNAATECDIKPPYLQMDSPPIQGHAPLVYGVVQQTNTPVEALNNVVKNLPALNGLALPVAFLRPGWFMENCALDVVSASEKGVIQSFLQPLDKAVPMVATADVGKLAASLLQQSWTGKRVVELEGPCRVSPNDIASTFSQILGRPVVAEAVARHTWETLFREQGHQFPSPRMQMIDGFNEGWICFEGAEDERAIGDTRLEEVLRSLLKAGN